MLFFSLHLSCSTIISGMAEATFIVKRHAESHLFKNRHALFILSDSIVKDWPFSCKPLASSDFGMNRKQWGSSQEASSECLFSSVLYPKSYSKWEVHHANSVNHCPNHHLLEADLSFV